MQRGLSNFDIWWIEIILSHHHYFDHFFHISFFLYEDHGFDILIIIDWSYHDMPDVADFPMIIHKNRFLPPKIQHGSFSGPSLLTILKPPSDFQYFWCRQSNKSDCTVNVNTNLFVIVLLSFSVSFLFLFWFSFQNGNSRNSFDLASVSSSSLSSSFPISGHGKGGKGLGVGLGKLGVCRFRKPLRDEYSWNYESCVASLGSSSWH